MKLIVIIINHNAQRQWIKIKVSFAGVKERRRKREKKRGGEREEERRSKYQGRF